MEGRGERELWRKFESGSGTSKEEALVRYSCFVCIPGGSLPDIVLLLFNLKAALLADADVVEDGLEEGGTKGGG
jgi:hypothetical protein